MKLELTREQGMVIVNTIQFFILDAANEKVLSIVEKVALSSELAVKKDINYVTFEVEFSDKEVKFLSEKLQQNDIVKLANILKQ